MFDIKRLDCSSLGSWFKCKLKFLSIESRNTDYSTVELSKNLKQIRKNLKKNKNKKVKEITIIKNYKDTNDF